ncbi:hypothetical protein ACTA71_004053 [Dictyostelium dimigraforme]
MSPSGPSSNISSIQTNSSSSSYPRKTNSSTSHLSNLRNSSSSRSKVINLGENSNTSQLNSNLVFHHYLFKINPNIDNNQQHYLNYGDIIEIFQDVAAHSNTTASYNSSTQKRQATAAHNGTQQHATTPYNNSTQHSTKRRNSAAPNGKGQPLNIVFK